MTIEKVVCPILNESGSRYESLIRFYAATEKPVSIMCSAYNTEKKVCKRSNHGSYNEPCIYSHWSFFREIK